MPPPPSIDRETFLGHLRQSGLVAEEELASLAALQPDMTRGKLFARMLVERGVLTRFQAERLLAGRPGGFFLGPYRVLELLGQGGMGRVYRAEHRTMKRIVALKVLANTVLQTERAVQLFLHEVRAAASLQHPNIVIAYDANEVDGRYYLVLEYVDGSNLDQLVRRQGPLPVGLACDYIRQAALGLQFAHQLGMVHRDIKPANILVQWKGIVGESPGLVKVSDFGLARLAVPAGAPADAPPGTILTSGKTVMGTPDYLSPEQARDLHQTDIRSDLYSLGCSLHYLLTGQPPFPGGTVLDKIIRHSTQPPRPLGEFRSDVPPEVAAIVARLMAKQPADRFATPADLAEALAPFAVSGPTPALPPPLQADVELVVPERSDGELAAMVGTDPGLMADTAHAASPSRIIASIPRREKRPIALALAIAFGVVALLVTLVMLLVLR